LRAKPHLKSFQVQSSHGFVKVNNILLNIENVKFTQTVIFADITEQKREKKREKFIINVKVCSTAIEEKTCESV
jgi:hypothetical protein